MNPAAFEVDGFKKSLSKSKRLNILSAGVETKESLTCQEKENLYFF
jgi:hypothetical protein